jgi:GNAT superfamily N-acetyltransferase
MHPDHIHTDPFAPFAAERAEAAWFFDWLDGAPEPARSVLQTHAVHLTGGGIATLMVNDPVNYWSKALGFDRPINRGAVAEIVDFYRSHGTPSATIQVAPALLPPDWHTICAEFGLTASSSWVKLAGSSSVPVEQPRGLRVAAVGPEDLDEWADAVFRGFGMPPEHLASLAIESARRRFVQPFGVWANQSIVAGASLAIVGGVGALLGAATLPEYRGRGAQKALITMRAQAARRAGIVRLTAETGRPELGGINHSLDNLLSAGLTPLYDRINWDWSNPDA